MAIIKVGTEADAFSPVSGQAYAVSTTAGRFDATLSRSAMLITRATSEITAAFGAAYSDLWLRFYVYQELAGGSIEDYIFIDGAAGADAYKIALNTDGTWTAYRYTGAVWTSIGTTSSPMFLSGSGYVDMHIVKHITTGEFSIYKDGVNVLSQTGNIDADNTMESIHFYGLPDADKELHISELIVADESTIGLRLATLTPDGNGALTAWTGDFNGVNESGYDANTVVEVNTTNQSESFTLGDINAAFATYNVRAVVNSWIALNNAGSAVNDVQLLVRTSGTNYTSANMLVSKDDTENAVQNIWDTNPNTASAWTYAEVNALETGIKSV